MGVYFHRQRWLTGSRAPQPASPGGEGPERGPRGRPAGAAWSGGRSCPPACRPLRHRGARPRITTYTRTSGRRERPVGKARLCRAVGSANHGRELQWPQPTGRSAQAPHMRVLVYGVKHAHGGRGGQRHGCGRVTGQVQSPARCHPRLGTWGKSLNLCLFCCCCFFRL